MNLKILEILAACNNNNNNNNSLSLRRRFQRPPCLRRGYAAARLVGLWVRIPSAAWMCVSIECCVLLGRGSLRWADHSPRGVLPSVVCLSVIVRPRQWGSPDPLGTVEP